MSMDDVLNGNADELLDQMAAQHQQDQERSSAASESDGGAQPDGEQQTEQPTGEQGDKPAQVPEDATKKDAPPASETDPHVPRKALEDERRKRQQLEQELAQLRQQQQPQRQPQGEQPQLPPEVVLQQQIINERLNMSEMIVRQQHEDVDTVIERFQQEVQKNPALGAQLQAQTHPWKWAYDYAKRLMLMDEIGGDPDAYKQRLREQVMAELQQQQPPAQESATPAAEKPNLPKSLANARSSAARSAPAWTGPTPLDDIIK